MVGRTRWVIVVGINRTLEGEWEEAEEAPCQNAKAFRDWLRTLQVPSPLPSLIVCPATSTCGTIFRTCPFQRCAI